MSRSQTASYEIRLSRLRQRYPEASDRELREKLACIQRGQEVIERIRERFAGVASEEIEREAVKAVKEVRRERREGSSARPRPLP
jgi:hypothetical protein